MSKSLDRTEPTSAVVTPSATLDVAGQAVRAFNHRTSTRFDDCYINGWNHVPDVCQCLGELTYLTGGLRQAIWHMSEAMQAQQRAGHVEADSGSRYDGRPEQAIAAACAALAVARTAAARLFTELDAAQSAISRIHYSGPDLQPSSSWRALDQRRGGRFVLFSFWVRWSASTLHRSRGRFTPASRGPKPAPHCSPPPTSLPGWA